MKERLNMLIMFHIFFLLLTSLIPTSDNESYSEFTALRRGTVNSTLGIAGLLPGFVIRGWGTQKKKWVDLDNTDTHTHE